MSLSSVVPRDRLRRIGYAAASTCGMVLCCPEYDLWWLGFFAWIPMFAAIEGLRPRAAFAYGWALGCATVFWGFFWLTELLTKFADFPLWASAPVTLLFAAYHGLIWAGAAGLLTWLRPRTKAPAYVLAPLCWVAMEAVLPNIFPIYMALGWCWQPLWIQAAEIGSVTAVSAIMVAINAGLYAVLRAFQDQRRIDRGAAMFSLAFLVGTPLYGAVRIHQVQADMDAAKTLKVGVVQGNMSIRELGIATERLRVMADQRQVSATLAAQGAELILWGETAYPHGGMFFRESRHEPPPGHPFRIHEGFDVPALIGTMTRDHTGVEPYAWNTALLLDGEGTILDHYDKVYRLVFGEYIPLVDPAWYLSKIPSASYLNAGGGPHPLVLGDIRLGPFICYEDIIPRYVRETAQQEVHLFVNLTNDAWFGKTREPSQHLGLAVFRAVEHRRGMVRAVNTGVSAYVDPVGRTLHRTQVTDPDVQGPQPAEGFIAEVPLLDPARQTPYGRTGELFNALCILALAGVCWKWPRP